MCKKCSKVVKKSLIGLGKSSEKFCGKLKMEVLLGFWCGKVKKFQDDLQIVLHRVFRLFISVRMGVFQSFHIDYNDNNKYII